MFITSSSVMAAVHLKAGYLNYVDDKIEVSKGVTIKNKKVTITAPKGTLNRDDNKAVLINGITMDYDQGNIKAQRLEAWLESDQYTFKKEVVLNQKEEGKNIKLKAPYLKLNQKTNAFDAKQGVEINYNKKLLKSRTATYNDKEGTLELKDDVYIEQENGDWVKGSKAVIYMDSEEERFTVDGNVEVEVNIGKDEKSEKQS